MHEVSGSPAFEHFLEFFVNEATPQEILAFRLSEIEQERIVELLARQEDGSLTAEESCELAQVVLFDRLMLTLRTRAHDALAAPILSSAKSQTD